MRQQVNSVVRSCNIQLRILWTIRRYLDVASAKTLAVSLVLSKLDYCNSLYYGLPSILINQLQRVQNSAARFVLNLRKSDHVSTALRHLHWLPIRYRIEYKIALITYKTLQKSCPGYLRDLLDESPTPRLTRSNNKLKVPRTKLKTAGDRSYSVAAPTIWNALPLHVTNSTSVSSFKKQLKTHYFKKAYFSA